MVKAAWRPRMTFALAVQLTREHVESQFPTKCSLCGRSFPTLADYLRATRHVGAPQSLDAEARDVPASPLGVLSFANCSCGTTLAIDSDDMPVETFRRLLDWAQSETVRRGISIGELLAEVRAEIDRIVLRG